MAIKRQYQRELDELIKNLDGEVPKLLLHSCCGPCSTYVLNYLAPHFEIVLFYDNPNIQPQEEFERRFAEQKKVIQHLSFPNGIMLEQGVYDPQRYAEAVRGVEHLGEGSERCFRCYAFRFQAAAERAKILGCDYFASTLSISPYKNVERINNIGEAIASRVGVTHLPNDFKKKGGYQASIAFCKEWGIYRQSYCGCIYSYHEWQERLAKQQVVDS